MTLTYEEFANRTDEIRKKIEAYCLSYGRHPQEVTLLPVTKNHPVTAFEYVSRYGLLSAGENRVQEAMSKKEQFSGQLKIELIGHLQTNKAKAAALHFDRIQSVDSIKLIHHLDRHASESDRNLPILLQFNAGNDPAKHGAEISKASSMMEEALSKKNLQIDGLMTIAPFSKDSEIAKRTFMTLRECRDMLADQFAVTLPVLSMGMSGDLEEAIAAGSTQVRIGTALFGSRE
ncbi:MAG: YggS family pyridoxal phosphate-dependent enzyme [Opitutaceae bacterium]|nr:YggS family pyridoxal phosphate-dependent enzyme [Opitutaceae bacterium]